MQEPKVIFVARDGGDDATGLEMATRLARDRSATLLILQVVPLCSEDGEAMLLTAIDLASGRHERHLDSLVPPDPTVPFIHMQEVGDPEARIIAVAERERADVIVLEATPKHWLARAFGPSLHERLIERCACPIVTYRPRPRASKDRQPSPRERVRISPEVLTTILNARVEALVAWLRTREETVAHASRQRSIVDAIASLCRARMASSVFTSRIRNLLMLELAEYQRAWGALGAAVVSPDETLIQIGVGVTATAAHGSYLERLRQVGKAVSLPLESKDVERTVVLVGATLPTSVVQAGLVFLYDARADFLRILAQPGPSPTLETYAFDERGVMLSNTRFPEELRKLGILPSDQPVQSPGLVRVCDPGGNLLAGQGSLGPSLPLTRAAAAATAGNDGSDFAGYRDYRGVDVVGVWRWIAEYEFGVVAEVDRAVLEQA